MRTALTRIAGSQRSSAPVAAAVTLLSLQRTCECTVILTPAGLQQPTLTGVQQTSPPAAAAGPWRGFAASAAAADAQKAGSRKQAERRPSGSYREHLEAAGKSGDLSRVYDVVEQNGENFDDADVEIALQQVVVAAEKSGGELEELVHKSPTFQLLVDMVTDGAERQPVDAVTRAIHNFARLNYQSQIVLDLLASKMMSHLDAMGTEQLLQMAEGLSRLDHSPSVQLLDSVCERMQELAQEGKANEEHQRALNKWLGELGHSCQVHVDKDRPRRLNSEAGARGGDGIYR